VNEEKKPRVMQLMSKYLRR